MNDQIVKIKDTLIGVANLYPLDQASIIPLVDVIHLLIQEPLSISFFTKPHPDGLIYTSLQDPELDDNFIKSLEQGHELEKNMVKIPGIEIYACIHSIDTSNGTKNAIISPVKPQIFHDFITHVAEDNLGIYVLGSIMMRLEAYKKAQVKVIPSLEERENDLSDVDVSSWLDTLLEPMRRAIDDACVDVMNSYALRKLPGEGNELDLPFLNLFCAVRTATNTTLRRNCFDYTARLLLSNNQKSEIIEWVESLGYEGEELCDYLEYPLGNTARSIADSVFSAGVIDFSAEVTGEGRDYVGEAPSLEDKSRQKAEQQVYSVIKEPHTFYVPVHINGVPWLALFTLTPRKIVWDHNYRVYRDLIPKIAEKLRAETKRVYLNLIRKTFAQHIGDSDDATLLDRVNKSWKLLTYVYPFNRVELLDTEHDDAAPLNLPNGRRVWLRMLKYNQNFLQQIPYEILDRNDIMRECLNLIDQILLMQKTKFELSFINAHDLRSTLQNAVITPLKEALNQNLSPFELQEHVKCAIYCVKHYCDNLSFLLDGYADFHTPSQQIEYQILDAQSIELLLTPKALALEQFSVLPNIELKLESDGKVVLNIPKRAFRVLLHLLIGNTIDAMHNVGLDIQSEVVRICANPQVFENKYCELTVWNSGTSFTQPVIDQAGVRPYTTRPGKQRSGLGFFVLETLLKLADAKLQTRNRHFDLENISNPPGAQVKFAIPVKKGRLLQ